MAALHDARVRRDEGRHLAEGARVCREALVRADVLEVLHVGGHDDVLALAGPDVRVTRVSRPVMERLSDAATAPGIVAVVRTPDTRQAPPAAGHLLVLDGVSDPGNVGTLIRSATAFGAAVVSVGGADPFGPKAVRASAGTCYAASISRLEASTSVLTAIRGEGRAILGLAADGATTLGSLRSDMPTAGVALVLGSEPHGLSASVRTAIDAGVRIPMADGVESLNVAAAGAIALHALMAGGPRA